MDQTFRYHGWGMDMIVPMQVPELAESKSVAEPDWELRIGPVPPVEQNILRFSLPNGLPAALVGTKLAYVAKGRPSTKLHPSLLRSVLAPLLRLRGHVVLHGSAVELNGRTVVLVGSSGSGKTTLAATLCAMGGRLLGDELCAVAWNEDCPMVLPGSRLLALHPKALQLPGLARSSTLQSQQDGALIRNKRILTHVPVVRRPREVNALCPLGWTQSTEPSITHVAGAERFNLLADARFQPGVGPRAADAEELPQLGKLLSKCPIVRLDRSSTTSPIESAKLLIKHAL